eukprot:15484454-Alexandrium_andersonii.AAC.1
MIGELRKAPESSKELWGALESNMLASRIALCCRTELAMVGERAHGQPSLLQEIGEIQRTMLRIRMPEALRFAQPPDIAYQDPTR